jgi:pyruvate,water dikinase
MQLGAPTPLPCLVIRSGNDTPGLKVGVKLQRTQVNELWRRLRDRAPHGLAVRSSAHTEDGEVNSYAGVFKTILPVRNPDTLYEAISEVASSAPFNWGSINVLIQPYVEAKASAVIFSSNPVTGDRSEIIVNFCWGGCDQIVKGEGVTETAINKITRSLAIGPPSSEEAQFINGRLDEIIFWTKRLEAAFATPVDLEVCWSSGSAAPVMTFLQCRPVTGTLLISGGTRYEQNAIARITNLLARRA